MIQRIPFSEFPIGANQDADIKNAYYQGIYKMI